MRTHDSENSAGELALRRGVSAARAGLHSVAAANFERAAENMPDDPNVWLWLAWTANSPDNTLRCLERVLELYPGHSAASAGLIWVRSLATDALPPAAVVTAASVVELPEPIVTPAAIVAEAPVVEVEQAPTVNYVAEPQTAYEPEPESAPIPAPEVVVATAPEITDEWHHEPAPTEHARRRWDELVQRNSEWQTGSGTFTVSPTVSEPPPLPTTPPPLPSNVATVTAEPEVAVSPRFLDASASDVTEPTADAEDLATSFSPPAEVAPSDGRPLVMVVDDSPTVRKLVSLTLERRGYRVVSAFDGVAAIKELGTCRPNLILLDINMPRLDGYRLCKLIKKHEATQNIPVVMLSGKDGMFDKLRGRLVGCSDYITKPFEADALTHKVAKYLTTVATSS
jgi:twitching motility two-component system response regulator PilG